MSLEWIIDVWCFQDSGFQSWGEETKWRGGAEECNHTPLSERSRKQEKGGFRSSFKKLFRKKWDATECQPFTSLRLRRLQIRWSILRIAAVTHNPPAVLSSQGRRRQEGEGRRQDTRAPGQRRTRGVGENPQTGPHGAEPRHRCVNTTHNSTQTWTHARRWRAQTSTQTKFPVRFWPFVEKSNVKRWRENNPSSCFVPKKSSLTLYDDNSSSECVYLFLLPLRSNRGLLN